MNLFGYTWVSFGLEVVSWLLLAIFRAARAAYTIVSGMLLGCAGGGVDTVELLEGGGSWVCCSVAARRSGSNIYSVSSRRYTVLVLDASSACRSSRSSVVISPASACLPWDSFESSLKWAAAVWASGQHTVSRLSQSSVTRLAARARHLCDPG